MTCFAWRFFCFLLLLTLGLSAGMGEAAELSYIKISSGASLTLMAGKTRDLTVTGYEASGKAIADPISVAWTSSNEAVAYVEQVTEYNEALGEDVKVYRLFATSPGTATITVETLENAANGKTATDTSIINVVEKMEHMTVSAAKWDDLDRFNKSLSPYGVALNFVDADPDEVSAVNFQQAFSNVWHTNPEQVTDLEPLSFKFQSSGPSGDWIVKRPGVEISLSGSTRGQLLPLKYVWSYSWNDLSNLLSEDVSSALSTSRLFENLRLDFYGAGGSTDSTAHCTVLGSGGVEAEKASAGIAPPLSLRWTGAGVSIELTVYLANVQGPAEARLIETGNRLIVTDGTADSPIAGTMWMLEKVKEKKGSGGGSSGGGCGIGFGALALLLLPALACVRFRRG